MKIEVGEFVRTKDGKIGKFDRYSSRPDNSIYKSPFDCFINLQGRKTPLQCHRNYIEKHSKDILDLIEVGDYMNGYKVIEVTEHTFKTIEHGGYKVHHKQCVTIKSIVTHQQFKQVEYEV